ncbi:MAG: DUF3422 domain-containing protein [Hyphomonas sp.]|uniref:DUF3422 family protein n=1 Tax=Hyphomonas sp. TaxID=87 RepID=UPI003527CFB4
MPPISDHPLRYMLTNELHARPFPTLAAPGRATYLALKPPKAAAARNRELERAHLIALLDRFGAPHPQPGATHWSGRIGRHFLKWESHTEFFTFTVFEEGLGDTPFDPAGFDVFPADWLAEAPGTRITSALIRVELQEGDEEIDAKADQWFVRDSLAISRMLDDNLVVATDFRIDPAGHTRLAIFARPGTGERRIGRVVQRLCEIETYKTMSMLGLARARELSPELNALEQRLTDLVDHLGDESVSSAKTLEALLKVSAGLEGMAAQASYRFSATAAYETIVTQRIEVLREIRFKGRQTFAEFMTRRFDPSMRTVKSTEQRLHTLIERAGRASDLLRTRVDVELSEENQKLLASMDRRADLQLRLQQTVEGLSVVAISYYALNLVLYLFGPVEKIWHIEKYWIAAIATPIVVFVVWLMIRRIRKSMH